MTRKRTARTAMVAAAVLLSGVGAATTASSVPPESALPDAILWCDDVRVGPDQWIAHNTNSPSLWVTDGPMTGHYILIRYAHYVVPGYLEVPPESYDGLEGTEYSFGKKKGLLKRAVECDLIARWGAPDDPETISVVGPFVMAKVSG